jgi:UDP-glucose 4-epimerase
MSGTTWSLRNKSILVTGGAGFIGSHLVDRILEENPARIVVVDNFFLGNDQNLESAFLNSNDLEVIRLDASDFPAMQDIVRANGTDVVFDLATIPLPTSLSFPNWTINTNVGIATTFCELARLEEISQLVHLSSSEAYGSALYVPMDELHPHNASTPYAASKSAGDIIIQSYVETYNINATIVRPFNNFGPRQNLGSYAGIIPIIVRNVVQGRPIEIYGDGLQTRDFIFVTQTVDMIVKIFGTPQCHQGTYNVASGVETSINELVKRMLDLMNVPEYPIQHLSPRIGDVRRHCADVKKTSAAIGKIPTPIEPDQLMQTIEWYFTKVSQGS